MNAKINGSSQNTLFTYGIVNFRLFKSSILNVNFKWLFFIPSSFKHDTYISAMKNLLGVGDSMENVNFGAAFVFELRKHARLNEYYVKVYYKNDMYPGKISINPVRIKGKL